MTPSHTDDREMLLNRMLQSYYGQGPGSGDGGVMVMMIFSMAMRMLISVMNSEQLHAHHIVRR